VNIFMNRRPLKQAWGGGNMFFAAFHKYMPQFGHKICSVEDLFGKVGDKPHLILIAGLDADDMRFSAKDALTYVSSSIMKKIKLVGRINDCDARKATSNIDNLWIKLSEYLDGSIFVSKWIKNYYTLQWNCKNSEVVCNGVDHSVFGPRARLNDGKTNIVTHHWSNNQMKGFDVYDAIDEFVVKDPRFTFTYIGRDQGMFKNTKVIKPLYGHELGTELGKYDVYVSGSRFDPGPNHVIEAISCELPTYVHCDGGGSVEFAGTDHSYKTIDELLNILSSGEYKRNKHEFNNWKTCMKQVSDYLESL
jgi:hypothetical protein